MVQEDRRVSGPALSPREAAFVTGLSEKTINQAIDRAEVEPLPTRRAEDRERMLPYPELVYLCVRGEAGPLLSPRGRRQLREHIRTATMSQEPPSAVKFGVFTVTIAPEIDTLHRRFAEMQQMWSFIVMDPHVRAGEPVVRGTRISVHMLGDLAAQGAPKEELLEGYPSLTPESLEAALMWARMYPRRGRPPRAPWKDGVVIRRGS